MMSGTRPAGRTRARAERFDLVEGPDLVGQYLDEIGTTPLLTAPQEVELAQRIEAGVYAAHLLSAGGDEPSPGGHPRRELQALVRDGEAARDHMLRANLRLVVAAARKYGHRGLPFLDVIQEGNLGLIRAVEKFDYAKGFKFSTYAMWWIRQSIERGLAEQTRTVRLPVHVWESLSKLRRVERELAAELDRVPSTEEVADRSGLSPAKVEELHRVAREAVSLDALVGDDGETRIGDLIEDTEVVPVQDLVESQALAGELRALVDTLPPREALIIRLRFGLDDGRQHTLQDIAERLGLTRERIRQLEKEALTRLRDPERHEPLLAWAG